MNICPFNSQPCRGTACPLVSIQDTGYGHNYYCSMNQDRPKPCDAARIFTPKSQALGILDKKTAASSAKADSGKETPQSD